MRPAGRCNVRLVAVPAPASARSDVSWRVWLVLGCAAVVAVGIAVLGDWHRAFHVQTRTTAATYPAAQVERLVLAVPGGGDVTVHNGSGVRIAQRTSKVAAARMHPQRTLAHGTLTIRDACAGGSFLGRASCSADYDVTVPEGVALVLSTVSGDVTLDSVAQAAQVRTVSGDIDASGCLARLDARTVAGDVAVETRCAPRTLFVETNSGDVELTIPRGSYDLTTDSASGDVSVNGVVDAPGATRIVRVVTSGGDIDVEGGG
jgi:hypothetical protein